MAKTSNEGKPKSKIFDFDCKSWRKCLIRTNVYAYHEISKLDESIIIHALLGKGGCSTCPFISSSSVFKSNNLVGYVAIGERVQSSLYKKGYKHRKVDKVYMQSRINVDGGIDERDASTWWW